MPCEPFFANKFALAAKQIEIFIRLIAICLPRNAAKQILCSYAHCNFFGLNIPFNNALNLPQPNNNIWLATSHIHIPLGPVFDFYKFR